MPSFTHLNGVSGYSARFGASLPDRLASAAAERGLDALALTDRDTVAGTVRFAKACSAAGVRPLFGVDLAVPQLDSPDTAASRRRTPVRGGAFVDEPATRAVFLARDRAGWAALCSLITAAHATDGAAQLGWRDVERAAADGGLVVLLGPGTEVGRAVSAGRPDRAERLLERWREMFGDALRLEVVHHGRPGAGPGSLRGAARMLGFAGEQGVRAVLSNAVRYADPGQREVADVLDAARLLVPIDTRKREGLDSGQRWLKGTEDMVRVAERVAEATGQGTTGARRLLEETARTAAECVVDPQADLGIGQVHFPEPELVGAGSRSADRVLRSRCTAAMVARRYDRDRRYWDRLDHELDIIAHHGFATYFLTVGQVVDDTRSLGIRVAARGSGAGSLVVHLLKIANADPIEHGLLMERFLSKERRAMPDIDIDVESERRLEVYRAIISRFGGARVATLAMPETYRVRHAVRDVGAALGLDPAVVGTIAKSFPHIRARDARAALAELPELRELAARADEFGRLWELVEALDGLPRGVAMHPCGVLISDATLLQRTPVVPTSGEGLPMSQFDKEDVEDLGLLKLDVLGVRMQSAMAHAVAEIRRATGEDLDLDDPQQVPPGDPATYQLIQNAETLGCFQIESPGQRDLVARLLPEDFHDLVVDISLFRPGPVAADMVRPFIEARHGRKPARYPHPDLEEPLRSTYGVVVFHEQVIEILRIMTGCSRGEADELRRALSNPEEQGRVRASFAERATSCGYDQDTVHRTWEILEAFGSYGFCKAHAVAFAVPTYQSAWLKAHRSAALYAGLLTADPGMWPKRVIVADARRRGVAILPLDVNRSNADYRIELADGRWGVRLALGEVHGISDPETARIVAGQPYTSLSDLWHRAHPSRPTAGHLIEVGATDQFLTSGLTRRDLLLQLSELHRAGRAAAVDGQLPLGGTAEQPTTASGLPEMNAGERMSAELRLLGLDASHHLMTEHAPFLTELGVVSATRLREARHGQTVLVAGVKAATQTPPIRSGKRVIFTTLDDGTGLVDLAFFDDSHAACAATVFHSGLLLVRGVVQKRGRALSVVGAAAWNLAELAEIRQQDGLEAVCDRIAHGTPDPQPAATGDDGRRIKMPTGYEMNPWADLQPPGDRAATGRKLWHSSPGSAGR